jgi:phosphoenolpyruvate phosphomutase / 2-hydroxyethylphosphonate cytidylyltransferase
MKTSNDTINGRNEGRAATLRDLLEERRIVRAIEAHNGLAALVAEHAQGLRNGRVATFDALWSSSLTDSLSRAKPDTEYVDFSVRAGALEDIRAVSRKPIIYDADTGGLIEHFAPHVAELERRGVAATIIEDKTGAKRNSLFGTEVEQHQEDPVAFAEKIAAGKAAQQGAELMIIARIESLILGSGVDDAIARARVYLEAGADGIMIHHKDRDPAQVWEFCARYRADGHRAPLVSVPSAYSQVTEHELAEAGIRIVIYANHLLRSAYPSMVRTAASILEHGRALEADADCLPIKDVIRLIEGGC